VEPVLFHGVVLNLPKVSAVTLVTTRHKFYTVLTLCVYLSYGSQNKHCYLTQHQNNGFV